jgi:hypothetical protein
MYLLPPQRIGGAKASFDSLYLITLVDERFFWRNQSAGTIHDDDLSTWANLITTLKDGLGITMPTPSIDSVYGTPQTDSGLYTNYESAAVLLDAVAFNLGAAIARNFDGTYTWLTPTDSITRLTASRPATRVSGGDLVNDADYIPDALDLALPSSVTVTFPKYLNPPDGHTKWLNPTDGTTWIQDSYQDVYVLTKTIEEAGLSLTGNGTEKIIHDTAKAIYSDESDDTSLVNGAELDALALRLAQDYFANHSSAVRESYHGILSSWQPEGFHDLVFCYRPGGAYTSTIPRPWNFDIQEMQHELTETVDEAPAAAGDTFVRCTGAVTSTANLYPGKILDPDPDSLAFTDGDDCWIFAPMGLALTNGDVYLAVANGKYTFDDVEKPLYFAIGGWVSDVACVSGHVTGHTY